MGDKLQNLTDKIYQEGVAKGAAEADRLVADAKKQAEEIIADANAKAEQILSNADKDAEAVKQNTNSELALSASQALNSLKQDLVDLVTGKISDASIKEAMADLSFVKNVIETSMKNWAGDPNMAILIPDTPEVNDYFASVVKSNLNSGFTIETAKGISTGFQIAAQDGSYKISFTEENFISFFKGFVRPKVAELLYSK